MAEHILDAKGLICPLPALKVRKKLLTLPAGDILRVQVTDKTAPKDLGLFCQETGHTLYSTREQDGVTEVVIICRGNT
jgi:tRNA 2-thiouridine synthesizing protein A